MLFPTVDFALFFCLVYLGHWMLNHAARPWKWFMIGASYFFYAWWDPRYIALLALVTVVCQLAAIAVSRQDDRRRRTWAMGIGVALTLAPLLFFKYYGFFTVNVTNTASALGLPLHPPLIQVILPIGVSFYTFMAISYVVDVYHGKFPVSSWTDVTLYLSFFPHLVAGPIVRPDELIPQLDVQRDARHVDVVGAGWLILGGLFKKIVIANYLATAIVEEVFGDPSRHGWLEIGVGIVAYAVQIYCDFSGYTDIAIGLAKLLGFRFPQNFDRPYSARSIQEFWRRWHMTLSRWLRDYLYIPLGGSRKGTGRTYVNLMITMLLGGLWHGAAWHFVVWGGLHGVYLVAGQWKRSLRERGVLAELPAAPWMTALQWLGAFGLVCVAWVFFRADSVGTALTMLRRLFTGAAGNTDLVTTPVLLAIAIGLATQFVPRAPAARIRAGVSRLRPVPMGIAAAFVLFAITTLGPRGVAPFIYFQF
ncbi:MAG TPA: MBOAT family protein [Actinomycetota bacterium]|nr:MBOAT family protein [Actinomycetota bacterium]